MTSYREKYSYILAPDHEFNIRFNNFINELVDARKQINSKKEISNKEPLIIISIDDIDLKTTKCKELIDTVLSCVCNKNIICFLSGDEEILNEAITLGLLENEEMGKNSEHILKENLYSMSLIDRKKL